MSTEALTPAAPGPAKTRAHALRSFDVADFPALTGREEEWRFTPLKRLGGLATADGAWEGQPGFAATSVEHDDLPAGVTVEWVGRDDGRIGSVLTPFDRISALAYGKFATATVVRMDRGALLDRPAEIRVVGAKAGEPDFGHMFIEVGEVAEGTLVIEYSGSATLADNVEVSVGASANLTLVTVADWAPDTVQAQHVKFRLGRDAKLTHIQVTLGGDLVRQYTSVEYADRGGDAELYGLYFATAPRDGNDGEHFEHRLLVDHAVPDCRSYVGYRGALQGNGAHTVWVGDVLIRAEATGTETYEINRNLVLSDGARADSVPNLEIETGEVVGAGHASATGRFDDEQLFYLMARGIPEEQARRLVVRGFFAELIGKIPVEALRERLSGAIEERLVGAGV
ncbi:MAG TPA: Fe-S cluster assembly protein SufD [Micromonosporaceae bacterium]|nr:Fe-S cluster assembly protein SufD [Micromonosporaceae bacterium]